ncbi:hypothetical protein FACS189430_00440 [Bacteroidia bacterium]|nr:hypothetical protein FACS189430_00440 [Bacteroidia bacterium]
MKDFIGLNGHFHFKPELYKSTTRLVRNYHDMVWDVDAPGNKITIPLCGNGVDWRDVYGPWKKNGFETNISIQLAAFAPQNNDNYKKLWKGKEGWMFMYGKTFASFYGPSGNSRLCTSIEIGNEPGGNFESSLYKTIFKNMASGIREGDPKVKILTPTVHARKADEYSQSLNDIYDDEDIMPLYDVINVHSYAQLNEKNKTESPWDRTYPEASTTDFLRVLDETIEWRNLHTPDKEIWVTEFGWDACTPDVMKDRGEWELKLNWQGCTDLQQAQYLVRSMLVFAERDLQRAYIYWYNDDNTPSTHGASGLTRNFEPKMSFWAMEQLYHTLGDYRFSQVVQRTDNVTEKPLYVYEFVHGEQTGKKIWVAWSPTGSQTNTKDSYQPVSFETTLYSLPYEVAGVESMATGQNNNRIKWEQSAPESITLTISESPVYILMDNGESPAISKSKISDTTSVSTHLPTPSGIDTNLPAAKSLTAVPAIPVSSINIPPTVKIKEGHTIQVIAKVLPANASYPKVVWSSDDRLIAHIDSMGRITGLNLGSTIIHATSADGAVIANCTVEVTKTLTATSYFVLDPSLLGVVKGQTAQINVLFYQDNAIPQKLIWKSNDEKIARVDQTGLVTGVGTGKTIVTATPENGNKEQVQSCTIQVTD